MRVLLKWVGVSSAIAVLGACGNTAPKDGTTPSAVAGKGSSAPTPPSGAPTPSTSAAALLAPSATAPAPLAQGGEEFAADVKDLFRVAACGGTAPVPTGFDAKSVDAHCAELKKQVDEYEAKWLDISTPFIAKLRPAGLPTDVVYPFGGGDLVTALAVYPDLTVVTTVSLEPAGDVRKFRAMGSSELRTQLGLARSDVGRLFLMSFHSTDHLDVESRTKIPGELFFALLAMRIHGYEPVGLRYFTFQPDGQIHYLEKDEIDRATASSHTFDDMELVFEKPGTPGSRKVMRHIWQNLDNKHFEDASPLMKHLVAKGDVSAITKAASHLMWSDDFSNIRGYLATHLVWMISDSTGIPPRVAKANKLVQETYGIFNGPAPYGAIDDNDAADFKKLFKENPQHDLPFFFGYWDVTVKGHLIVTHRAGLALPPP